MSRTWWSKFGEIVKWVRLVHITPEMAREWLKRNANNRPLKPGLLKRYIQALQRGEFILNGETIIFGRDGLLQNGQHRLTACVNAGIGFWSLVAFDVDANAFATQDQGKSRSPADALALAGYKNSNDLSQAIPLILANDADKIKQFESFRGTCTGPERIAFIEKNLLIIESVVDGRRIADATKLNRTACMAAHFLLARVSRLVAAQFHEAMTLGVLDGQALESRHPLAVLREWAYRRRAARQKDKTRAASTGDDFAVCAKAINAWLGGRTIKKLQLRADEDYAPIALHGGAR